MTVHSTRRRLRSAVRDRRAGVVFEQNAIFGEHYPLRYGRREDLLGRTSTTNMSALAILRLSLSGYDFRRLDWSVLREPELIYR